MKKAPLLLTAAAIGAATTLVTTKTINNAHTEPPLSKLDSSRLLLKESIWLLYNIRKRFEHAVITRDSAEFFSYSIDSMTHIADSLSDRMMINDKLTYSTEGLFMQKYIDALISKARKEDAAR